MVVNGYHKVSDILFEDIEINDCGFYPINVSLLSNKKGEISNITFRNISIPNSNEIRLLNKASQGTLDGIHFENITRNGIKVMDADGMRFKTSDTVGTINNLTLDGVQLHL